MSWKNTRWGDKMLTSHGVTAVVRYDDLKDSYKVTLTPRTRYDTQEEAMAAAQQLIEPIIEAEQSHAY